MNTSLYLRASSLFHLLKQLQNPVASERINRLWTQIEPVIQDKKLTSEQLEFILENLDDETFEAFSDDLLVTISERPEINKEALEIRITSLKVV